MLFYVQKGKNATQTKKKICAVCGEDAGTKRMCQRWFAKFHTCDTTLKDEDRSEQPAVVNDDKIKNLIENNQRYTRDRLHRYFIYRVIEHLSKLGYVNCFDV